MNIIHNIFLDIGFKPWEQRLDYQRNIKINKKINPECKFILWDDEKVNNFIKEQPKKIQEYWLKFPHTFYKIDFVRYLILEKFGGIYLDLDVVCKIPLEKTYYIGFWEDKKKSNYKINNNIICLEKSLYPKLIKFSLEQFDYREISMPKTWVVRKFHATVSAGMFRKFIKKYKSKKEIEKMLEKFKINFDAEYADYNYQWNIYGKKNKHSRHLE